MQQMVSMDQMHNDVAAGVGLAAECIMTISAHIEQLQRPPLHSVSSVEKSTH